MFAWYSDSIICYVFFMDYDASGSPRPAHGISQTSSTQSLSDFDLDSRSVPEERYSVPWLDCQVAEVYKGALTALWVSSRPGRPSDRTDITQVKGWATARRCGSSRHSGQSLDLENPAAAASPPALARAEAEVRAQENDSGGEESVEMRVLAPQQHKDALSRPVI